MSVRFVGQEGDGGNIRWRERSGSVFPGGVVNMGSVLVGERIPRDRR